MALTGWTYLSFPGNAKQAMSLYQEVFGGELELMTYADMKIEGMPFEPDPASVAHATLTVGDLRLAGGDDPGLASGGSMQSDVYSILLGVDDDEEARRLVGALVARGGTVAMPYEAAPWGGMYGQVRDPFGVLWAFSSPAEAP